MTKRSARSLFPLVFLAACGGVMPGLVNAQGEQQPTTPFSGGPIEEVVVTGQRTIVSLINEAQRETENFYARLNDVLDNEDFRIRCQIEYPAGSRIATRVCRMRFQEELLSRAALSDIQNLTTNADGEIDYTGAGFDYTAQWMAKQRQFAEEVLTAVNTDIELNQSVVRLLQLKAAVENYETPASQRRRERREVERQMEEADN